MKQFFTLLFLITCFTSFSKNESWEVNYSNKVNIHELHFQFEETKFESIIIDGKKYTKLLFDHNIHTKKKGWAELPYVNTSIAISDYSNYKVVVKAEESEEIQLDYPLIPSKGSINRDQDPKSVKVKIAPESIVDQWYPQQSTSTSKPYLVRAIRGINVYMYPFQYNAKKNTLKVIKSISIQLVPDDSGIIPINPSRNKKQILKGSLAFYNSFFINPIQKTRESLVLDEFGDLLIITTDRDEEAIKPYISWKKEKGFNVNKIVVEKGTNVKDLIKDEYDKNNKLLYVLLVGDYEDIKSDKEFSSPIDQMLGCVSGDDYYLDLCIGRFSANSPEEVQTIVDKVINYEKNPKGDFYKSTLGIGSREGLWGADDNEVDYVHVENIYNGRLKPNGYDKYYYCYEPNDDLQTVIDALNNGVGVVNYAGHGSKKGWKTSGFSNTEINGLTNGDKLPIIFTVACINGSFEDESDCFAETFLKKKNGGAIAVVASTINQPWIPPMRGQDYMNDILTGGYSYITSPGCGISTDEGRTTFGSIVSNALILMLKESNTIHDVKTVKTWTTFGDPTLQVRTSTAKDIKLSNEKIYDNIPFSTTVFAENVPFPNAYITISQGDIYVTGKTDDNGMVTIDHSFSEGNVKFVVTGQNLNTVYTEKEILPNETPNFRLKAITINDSEENNNQVLENTETIKLSIELENIGAGEGTDLSLKLSTTDNYYSIIDNTELLDQIPSSSSKTLTDAFEVRLLKDTPNNHNALFSLIISGTEEHVLDFIINSKAPQFDIESSITEPNNDINPGEGGSVSVKITNNSTIDALNFSGDFISDSEYITIGNESFSVAKIKAGETIERNVQFSTSANTPQGTLTSITFKAKVDNSKDLQVETPVVIGKTSILILECINEKYKDYSGSAQLLEKALRKREITYKSIKGNDFPEEVNLSKYKSVWVMQGCYPYTIQLASEAKQKIFNYLLKGGFVYLEGAESWNIPSKHTNLFQIKGIRNSTKFDTDNIKGLSGTIAEGFVRKYKNATAYINKLTPQNGSQAILINSIGSTFYNCVVSYIDENSGYKTIGSSIELRGLIDDVDDSILDIYLKFFNLKTSTEKIDLKTPLKVYPNPFKDETSIAYFLDEDAHVTIDIYDINGKKISSIENTHKAKGQHLISLSPANIHMEPGLFLCRITINGISSTHKMIKW
ncbi:MAG: C25 family cysteine peptidase [Hyphomicrobiales bacterium]